jgi:hypothetical protein
MIDDTVKINVTATDNATSVLKGIGASAVGLGLAFLGSQQAIRVISECLKEAVNSAAQAETGMSRLNATLTSTGRGMEISSRKIDEVAKSLMKVSTFDDEAIVGAYNTLMKFDNIPVDKMEQVIKSAMDMSAALGGDLVSNAEQIGRVLETGLIPRTWAFDTALKSQVATMIKAGDSAGALNIIMGELNKRYGGQAAAQLDTYTGKVLQLKNAWAEVGESFGTLLLPALKNVADGLYFLTTGTLNAEKATELLMKRTGQTSIYENTRQWTEFFKRNAGAIYDSNKAIEASAEAMAE